MPREQACLAANISVFTGLLLLLIAVYIPSKQRTEQGVARAASSQLQRLIQQTATASQSRHLLPQARFDILKWNFNDFLQRYADYEFMKQNEFQLYLRQQEQLMAEIEDGLSKDKRTIS